MPGGAIWEPEAKGKSAILIFLFYLNFWYFVSHGFFLHFLSFFLIAVKYDVSRLPRWLLGVKNLSAKV